MKDLYLRIYENKMYLSLEPGEEGSLLIPEHPFSTPRLLVGDLAAAVACLGGGIRKLVGRSFLKPIIVVEPMECMEGGPSEAERIILAMLGYRSGAREVRLRLNGTDVGTLEA